MAIVTVVSNDASAQVLQKAGFVLTRILAGHDLIDGVEVDGAEYVRGVGLRLG